MTWGLSLITRRFGSFCSAAELSALTLLLRTHSGVLCFSLLLSTSPKQFFVYGCKLDNSWMASSSLPRSPTTFRSLSTGVKEFPRIASISVRSDSNLNNLLYSSHLSPAKICNANGHRLPIIRAQNSADYAPDANFYKVEAILRPWRIPQVSSALLKMGIRGVTVSDVRGFGAQGGLTERHAGSEFSEDKFLAKVKMEIVVSKDQVEAVIEKIIEEARTGEIGDGKIFLVPVADVIRVRTGERGFRAERMMGGRADMFSAESPA